MTIPKVIIHNSVSLDGSVTDFQVNMELHYQISGEYKEDIHFIGANTIKTGIELFLEEIPPENESDFEKPEPNTDLFYWVVPDTTASEESSRLMDFMKGTKRSFSWDKAKQEKS